MKKRVAIIVPTLRNGGAERVAGLLSIALNGRYSVFLFVHDDSQRVYECDGTVICIQDIQNEYKLSFNDALRQAKEKNKIDVSISFLGTYNYANICTRGHERIIISERNAQSKIEPRMSMLDKLMRDYYGFADAVVACSEGVRYDLISEYDIEQKLVHTIYNYVDQEVIKNLCIKGLDAEVEKWLDGAEFFLNIGRLSPQKQQQRLIHQFFLFHKTDTKNSKLIIIGSGLLESDLKELIINYKMENSVLLIPYIDNPFPFIKKSKCVILSSHYEGLPNVLLETMTIGRPIIATDCLAGPRELLNDDTDYSKSIREIQCAKRGLLIPDIKTDDDGSTHFLADAMHRICREKYECERFVEEQAVFMGKYHNNSITGQWIEVIEDDNRKDIDISKMNRNVLEKAEKIYIYGAGKRGRRIFEQIQHKYRITGYIVSDGQKGDEHIDNMPVFELSDVNIDDDKTAVILGVINPNYMDEIVENLEKQGVKHLVFPGW